MKLQPGSKGIRRLRCSNKFPNVDGIFWIRGSKVIHVAAGKGFYEISRNSLEKIKVDTQVPGGFFGTALQAAAAEGHENFVKLYLKYRADVKSVSGYYGTALQAAAAGGYEEIVHLLLSCGADVNTTGGDHYTALHAAVCMGFESIARSLLEHGADVNARGSGLGTVLHTVKCIANEQNCTDLLLAYGAEDRPPIENPSAQKTDSKGAILADAESN